ncbi:unnamed protein product [Adineta steineri]|uniref:Uncharacterized protein n=1 Tax=Adineta steineri TaxID=433720 RepID=A0A815B7W2_9BILA|nr:unnamed protein product [Adineta steineri]CAF1266518.1 unnamed protein product [Adineta steineri]CAF1278194.1 unnamed protein product [Adineta steineri]
MSDKIQFLAEVVQTHFNVTELHDLKETIVARLNRFEEIEAQGSIIDMVEKQSEAAVKKSKLIDDILQFLDE